MTINLLKFKAMKKLVLVISFAVLSFGAVAQSYKSITKGTYKNNEDIEIAKERVKADIDKNTKLSGFQRSIAKKMAGTIVKRAFKEAAENRYVLGYTDGEQTLMGYYDVTNNRSIVFVPQMGRIVIQDWKNGLSIVAFPKLKVACTIKFDPESAAIKQSGQLDTKSLYGTKTIPEGIELTEVNGWPAIENIVYLEIEEGKTPQRTMVIDGKTMEVFPMPGHLLRKNDTEYFPGVYVDGEQNTPVLSVTAELVEFEECPVNEANFKVPDDYQMEKDLKAINKKYIKDFQENKQVMPVPDKMPEILWP